jgi:hypothetical protein
MAWRRSPGWYALTRPCPALAHRSGEIAARKLDDTPAEFITQRNGLDLRDRAFGKIAQLERPERHPDQAVHL